MELKDLINKLPSSVSGDGKNFVMMLKKILGYIKESTQEQIDESVPKPAAEFVNNLQLVESTPNLKVTFGTVGVKGYTGAYIDVKKDDGAWQRVGETTSNSYTINNVTVGSTYYVRVIAKGFESAVEEAPVAYTKIKGNTLICDTPKQFYLKWDGVEALWEWGNYTDNGYTDFYELRLDKNAGVWNDNLLEQTRNNYSTVAPRVNNGTAYLYVRNKFGQYNNPAVHIFNLAIDYKPNAPAMYNMIRGVEIIMSPLPEGCDSYRLNIDGETYESISNRFFYYKTAGTITVSYCFVSGDSAYEYSDPVEVKISALTVKTEDIADGAVTHDKLAANSVYADNLSANSVMAKHLYGETINLSNELAIAGGAVKLDEDGLHCTMGSGSVINFNTEGMTVLDSNGRIFSQLARFASGVAEHGETVRLNWDIAPRIVILVPYAIQSMVSGYTSSDLYIKYFASNITPSGFLVNCYTTVASGSYARQVVRDSFLDTYTTPTNSTWRDWDMRTPFMETITLPAGVSEVSFQCETYWSGYIERDHGLRLNFIKFEVYLDDEIAYTYDLYGSMTNRAGDTEIRRSVDVTFNTNGKSTVKFALYSSVQSRRESSSHPNDRVVQNFTNGVVIGNVTGDTVISTGSATYFAIG